MSYSYTEVFLKELKKSDLIEEFYPLTSNLLSQAFHHYQTLSFQLNRSPSLEEWENYLVLLISHPKFQVDY